MENIKVHYSFFFKSWAHDLHDSCFLILLILILVSLILLCLILSALLHLLLFFYLINSMYFCSAGRVLRSYVRHQFFQPTFNPSKEVGSTNRKSFVNLNAASEELGPLPKIINVSSLASSNDLKFSQSLVNFMRSTHTFFTGLSVQKRVKLLTRLKSGFPDSPNYNELAEELDVPIENMRGWLNRMKNRCKINALEEVPQSKIHLLNDEFHLSETLGEDRLLLLSHILKIEERVIQKFFDSKRDCKKNSTIPACKSSFNNAAAFGNLLIPCVRLDRCSVPLKKPVYYSDSFRRKIFTPEQLTILRDKYSRCTFLRREEAVCLAQQLSGFVTAENILSWFSKTRYRQKMRETATSTTVTIEPYSTRTREKEGTSNSPKKTELRSDHCQNKLEVPSNVETEPHSAFRSEKFGPLAAAVQNALFEEYKKSPVLSARRRNSLQASLKIQSSRIDVFFNKLSSLLRGKTENDVTKLLTSYPKVFLSKIAAEHRRSRYISVMKSQKLAKQLGTSRHVVIDWFNNARLYELLSGNRFHPIVKPSPSTLSVGHVNRRENVLNSTRARRTMQSSPAVSALNTAVNTKTRGKSEAASKKNVVRPSRVIPYSTTVREILFNAFKQSSLLSKSSLHQICSASNLSTRKVTVWFRRTRNKLTSVCSEKFIFQSEYRNLRLPPEHIVILEKEFRKHPYESEKLRDELATQLNSNRGTIRKWFANRRQYDLIIFGMPELVKMKKVKNISDSLKKSVRNVINVDSETSDSSSDAEEMATSDRIPDAQNLEVQLFPLEDIASNNSNINYHPDVDEGCALLEASSVKEEQFPKEPGSPCEVRSFLPEFCQIENCDVICQSDSVFKQRVSGSMPLSEILEPAVDNLKPSTDNEETWLSQCSLVANCNVVSMSDLCDAPELHPTQAPRVEELPYVGMEAAVISPNKTDSTEKNVAICETANTLLGELSFGQQSLLAASKPSVDFSYVCETLAATCKETSNGLASLCAMIEPSANYMKVSNFVPAAPEKLAGGQAPWFDVYKPPVNYMDVYNSVPAAPEKLSDGLVLMSDEPLTNYTENYNSVPGAPEKPSDGFVFLSAVCNPSDLELEVSGSMVAASKKLLNNWKPSPILKPIAYSMDVSDSVVTSIEEARDTLKPVPDDSKFLVDYSRVPNTVAAIPEELADGSDLLLDASESPVNHCGILTNGFVTSFDNSQLYDTNDLTISPVGKIKQSMTCSIRSPAKKPLLSPLQRKTLLLEYKKSPFLFAPKAQMLATDLNLSVRRIKLWFQKRRFKESALLASNKLVDEKIKLPGSSQFFSAFQLFVLEREFGENSELTKERLTLLCQKLKTSGEPIVAWFDERNKLESTKI